MSKGKITAVLLAGALSASALALCACQPAQPKEIAVNNMRIEVRGYEWGPAVSKAIVEFSGDVSGISKNTFEIKTANKNRTVTDAYTCDRDGKKTTASTKYAAIEMSVKYGEASPFSYDMQKSVNKWADSYSITVTAKSGLTVDGAQCEANKKFTYKIKPEDRLVPQTASWTKDTYTHGGYTLQRASWTPEGAKTDSGKNPLIIWLHGMGEGGTDIDIDLLGNEVTALTTENETNIQHYFTTDTQKGAYVLAVQTPTMWMDSGDGQINTGATNGKQLSIYTETLYKAIDSYVQSNSDIDTNRIYVGGCSNGGYMTMNMMFEHGDYFAAYYPICEAYKDSNISDDMIAQVKDNKIWFVQSEADNTVNRNEFVTPTYVRLLEAGAQNVHFTLFDKVRGTDDPNPSDYFGNPTDSYDGHWVWIHAFNDQIKKQFDNSQVSSAADLTSAKCTADGNMWQWLSEQSK